MNARARQLGPHAHALHDAHRARHAGQLLERRRSGQAGRLRPHALEVLRAHRRPAHRGAPDRTRARRHQPQRPRRRVPLDRRSQDRPHARRRLRSRRLGAQRRHDADQRGARNRRARARATRTRWPCWITASPTSARGHPCAPGRSWPGRPSATARASTRVVRAAAGFTRIFAAPTGCASGSQVPRELTGPLPGSDRRHRRGARRRPRRRPHPARCSAGALPAVSGSPSPPASSPSPLML